MVSLAHEPRRQEIKDITSFFSNFRRIGQDKVPEGIDRKDRESLASPGKSLKEHPGRENRGGAFGGGWPGFRSRIQLETLT